MRLSCGRAEGRVAGEGPSGRGSGRHDGALGVPSRAQIRGKARKVGSDRGRGAMFAA